MLYTVGIFSGNVPIGFGADVDAGFAFGFGAGAAGFGVRVGIGIGFGFATGFEISFFASSAFSHTQRDVCSLVISAKLSSYALIALKKKMNRSITTTKMR